MSAVKKLILVVEDDESIAEALRTLLEGEGYDVLSAENGLEALSVLKKHTDTSLVLLDLMMPVMDAIGFRKAQILNQAIKGIPVVLMSADSQIAQKNMEVRANEYIKKPFDVDAILRVVENQSL